MKALTVWQPWASLIAEGHKKIETRSWSTSIRGAVAIHSAKKTVKETTKLMTQESIRIVNNRLYPYLLTKLPAGYILAVGNLVDCKLIDEAFIETLSADELPLGDYTLGSYAWIFNGLKSFKAPILAKGAQGFWEWKTPHGIEVAP